MHVQHVEDIFDELGNQIEQHTLVIIKLLRNISWLWFIVALTIHRSDTFQL